MTSFPDELIGNIQDFAESEIAIHGTSAKIPGVAVLALGVGAVVFIVYRSRGGAGSSGTAGGGGGEFGGLPDLAVESGYTPTPSNEGGVLPDVGVTHPLPSEELPSLPNVPIDDYENIYDTIIPINPTPADYLTAYDPFDYGDIYPLNPIGDFASPVQPELGGGYQMNTTVPSANLTINPNKNAGVIGKQLIAGAASVSPSKSKSGGGKSANIGINTQPNPQNLFGGLGLGGGVGSVKSKSIVDTKPKVNPLTIKAMQDLNKPKPKNVVIPSSIGIGLSSYVPKPKITIQNPAPPQQINTGWGFTNNLIKNLGVKKTTKSKPGGSKKPTAY